MIISIPLRRNILNKEAVMYLQQKLVEAGYNLIPDGDFGPKTERVVRELQIRFGLVDDGIVGIKTWNAIYHIAPNSTQEWKRFLREDDLVRAAKKLGVDLATIKTINEVESGGYGFIGNKPRILFEGHQFWKRLKVHGLDPNEISNEENYDILYPEWTKEHYAGGVREHYRLDRAVTIHPEAALESASWGLFQVLGLHWKDLKYESINAYVDEMYKGEAQQLEAFVRYVIANDLVDYLKNKEWEKFARKYNGSGYRKNNYHVKLMQAYDKFKDWHLKIDEKTGEILS